MSHEGFVVLWTVVLFFVMIALVIWFPVMIALVIWFPISIIRNIRKGKHPLTGEPDSLARQNKENKE